jgi:ABC-type multidrug transport system ATPase subunit
VDLSLPPAGWIVVAGRNGSGKTTLLRVLALALSPVFSHDYADTLFSWVRHGEKTARSRITLVPSPEEQFEVRGRFRSRGGRRLAAPPRRDEPRAGVR